MSSHLDVYEDRSELIEPNKETIIFREGVQCGKTQQRYSRIVDKLNGGYLESLFLSLSPSDFSLLSVENRRLVTDLVYGYTSEVGRALVGVAFLQMVIKCLEPDQCIRLHKGSLKTGSFSWVDGISMRTLDRNFTTPFLRKKGLLKLNRDGVFMTRSLAENYPYTKLYKAEMRGPFEEWIKIVDALENKTLPPREGVCFLLSLLKNKSDSFSELSNQVIDAAKHINNLSFWVAEAILKNFFENTKYSARAFEVVLHCLMQAIIGANYSEFDLVPLSQMRSANKKHGNIGDIELKSGRIIIESWDAKYGKSYLRDELEELRDKILSNPGVKLAGFVTDKEVDKRADIIDRAEEISLETGVDIRLLSFDEWVDWQTSGLSVQQKNSIANHWLISVAESFGQKRRSMAPIDEPCDEWLKDFYTEIKAKNNS